MIAEEIQKINVKPIDITKNKKALNLFSIIFKTPINL